MNPGLCLYKKPDGKEGCIVVWLGGDVARLFEQRHPGHNLPVGAKIHEFSVNESVFVGAIECAIGMSPQPEISRKAIEGLVEVAVLWVRSL